MKSWRTAWLMAGLLLWPQMAEGEEPHCKHYTPNRQPFFGQTHLHTSYSADASTLQTRLTPRDAYRFAQGEKVGLAPYFDTRPLLEDKPHPPIDGVTQHPYCIPPEQCQYTAMRTLQLPPGRALDFAAVTDHSEFLGETNICYFEGLPCNADGTCDDPQLQCTGGACVPEGYSSPNCVAARSTSSRLIGNLGAGQFFAVWANPLPTNPPYEFCTNADGENVCAPQAKNVWQQIIRAAEEAYDTTDQCRFTSFIGYEYTSNPTMGQCRKSFAPCFADADCGRGDRCGTPGQCTEPFGQFCFVPDPRLGSDSTTGCASGASCIAANTGGSNLHRNIIFRNSNVPDAPISYVDVPTGCGAGDDCLKYGGPEDDSDLIGQFSTESGVALGSPRRLLEALEAVCHPEMKEPCEFLSIPHNSNLSNGAMFMMPESREDAEIRSKHERLVEILQIKGNSECRTSPNDPIGWQPGATSADELCDFENMNFATLAGAYIVDPTPQSILPSGYVRNALKQGLKYQQGSEDGVNPFQLGFLGSLDNHNGTPTATEVDYSKVGAHGDNSFAASGQMLNETYFLGYQSNGGGLGVVWAEENTRDSIFSAMQRRETYATSGTRPIVRFFGGFALPETMCRKGDFPSQGYRDGNVSMGGTLTPRGDVAPRFAISALMDPGWVGHPGATLQRVQIIKGWLETIVHKTSGKVERKTVVREQVYEVAGSPEVAPVDLNTCAPTGPAQGGHAELCNVWTDPDYDPEQHAFYYARVVENPSCRWNQYYCLDRGVDCTRRPELGNDVVGYEAYDYAQCCGDAVPKAVQQRAWTSPIWVVPEGRR